MIDNSFYLYEADKQLSYIYINICRGFSTNHKHFNHEKYI